MKNKHSLSGACFCIARFELVVAGIDNNGALSDLYGQHDLTWIEA
jgi:hypothetical protein